MRAFIIVSIASINLSAEIALVFFRSSISLRICRSRAAHPRVNEPAVVPSIMAPRHTAATATWTEQFSKCFVTADLPDFVGAADIIVGAHRRGWLDDAGKQPAWEPGAF